MSKSKTVSHTGPGAPGAGAGPGAPGGGSSRVALFHCTTMASGLHITTVIPPDLVAKTLSDGNIRTLMADRVQSGEFQFNLTHGSGSTGGSVKGQTETNAIGQTHKKAKKMSAKGRKAIAAAQKKRWAVKHAEKTAGATG